MDYSGALYILIIRRPDKSGDVYLSYFVNIYCFYKGNDYFRPYISICRTIIHYKCGLYHGMEHGLIMFRPAIVRDILPDEWTRTSRRPYGPVYIN